VQKLREELAPYFEDVSSEIWHQNIAHLDHLNGVIWEALRLYPPVPSALQRMTPPEGIDIDGTFIPGNMTVYCPQYVIGRSEFNPFRTVLQFLTSFFFS
jgi:tryprostatin B 6-hydroxylase